MKVKQERLWLCQAKILSLVNENDYFMWGRESIVMKFPMRVPLLQVLQHLSSMHSVEMNISLLQQSQVQSMPDLQPAAVKNPKFRKGRQSLEELLGGSFHHELMGLHKSV